MSDILNVKGLNKIYTIGKGNKQQVLKDIDLQIKKGEFVSVMGPSGSGKSTLLYNISGMDKMTTGSVVINGNEISILSEKDLAKLRLNKMGFIFQQSNLLKNLSIFDNIVVSAYLTKNESRKKINERAVTLMNQTGIINIAENDITQASGGQLQRASICRALINKPDIVFGDEPTGALNSKSASEVMEILADINQLGTTIMLVTHDSKVAAKTERVLFMMDGAIVSEIKLGKYINKYDLKLREEKLIKWLGEMGF